MQCRCSAGLWHDIPINLGSFTLHLLVPSHLPVILDGSCQQTDFDNNTIRQITHNTPMSIQASHRIIKESQNTLLSSSSLTTLESLVYGALSSRFIILSSMAPCNGTQPRDTIEFGF